MEWPAIAAKLTNSFDGRKSLAQKIDFQLPSFASFRIRRSRTSISKSIHPAKWRTQIPPQARPIHPIFAENLIGMTKIALLNIGTELLRGRTINTNASQIGIMLGAAGFALETTLVIHDNGPVITQAVQDLLSTHDVVLLTGGLGPTTDDITKKTLLALFGGEMICHQPTLERIKGFLETRKMPLLEHNRQQSFVPSTCEVIENEQGTAPGMVFRRDGKTLISMPGVPFEMKHLMTKGVLPLLQRAYQQEYFIAKVVRTFGLPESRIAELMEPLVPQLDPQLEVAYLPSFDGTKIELKMRGAIAHAPQLEAAAIHAQAEVAKLVSKYVYTLEDKAPVKLLAEKLLKGNIQICTAESCTGGAIAALLVEQSGISAVMRGGVVAYMRESKETVLGVPGELIDNHGIVSAQVAESMAAQARKLMGSDIAVSITGIAEAAKDAPPNEQPQAWIGFADANGSRSMHIRLFRDRHVNIQFAVQAALVFVLQCSEGE